MEHRTISSIHKSRAEFVIGYCPEFCALASALDRPGVTPSPSRLVVSAPTTECCRVSDFGTHIWVKNGATMSGLRLIGAWIAQPFWVRLFSESVTSNRHDVTHSMASRTVCADLAPEGLATKRQKHEISVWFRTFVISWQIKVGTDSEQTHH